MQPDTSAMLVLIEDTYAESLVNSMSGVDANVVTLTVGDELSGEMTTFVAGKVDAVANDEG